jgi:hypothetical protein
MIKIILGLVVGFFVFIALLAAILYYTSSVKADFYKRQGIDITTWEVMCGARPVTVVSFETDKKN